MRVLMQSRVTLFSVRGGDTTQVLKTAEALRALGVVCEISTELQPDLSNWDLVHLFNLTRPQDVYLQARNVVRQHKPIALSTIYLAGSDYDRSSRSGIVGLVSRGLPPNVFEYAKVLARAIVNGEWHDGTWAILKHGFRNLQDEIIRMSSVLLPNSHSEMQRVIRDFPVASKSKFVVVPNSVDDSTFHSQGDGIPPEFERFRGAVLCVAGIGHRKNQLRLVKALKGVDMPLVLVGQPTPNAQRYFRKIKREAGANVHFVGQVNHEEVRHYYRVAKVHVLASWMETTGLSSLEAGLAGCNLVITDRGDTREYFGDMAFYCDPGSEISIRDAVLKAYAAPVCTELQDRIRSKFNWTKTAEATLDAYRQILFTERSVREH
ncbi:MAG TPA: glycosyltransferase family 4 protein [Terracidiphilus sp.]|nr:glycosyltransferase family 4 protein [Terracidiphilus sp.]